MRIAAPLVVLALASCSEPTSKGEPASRASAPSASASAAVSAAPVVPSETTVGDGVDQAFVLRILRMNSKRFHACNAGDVGAATPGTVVVDFEIDDEGAVAGAKSAASTTMKDAAIVGCVEKVVAGLSFPQPASGTSPKVTAPFVYDESGFRIDAEGFDAGALDEGRVKRWMALNAARFSRCYQAALKRSPGLAGKLELVFSVEASGAVTDAKVEPDAKLGADDALGACVVAAVEPIRFPRSSGGQEGVRYPLVFAPE